MIGSLVLHRACYGKSFSIWPIQGLLFCDFSDTETINSELPDNKKQLEKAKVDLEKTEAEEKKLCEEVNTVLTNVGLCKVLVHSWPKPLHDNS